MTGDECLRMVHDERMRMARKYLAEMSGQRATLYDDTSMTRLIASRSPHAVMPIRLSPAVYNTLDLSGLPSPEPNKCDEIPKS